MSDAVTLASEARRLGLTRLGPVPADLPDEWLAELEARAERIEQAAQEAEYRMMTGEDAPPSGLYHELLREYVLGDALEEACRARLAIETGLRRRWLDVLRKQCLLARVNSDAEHGALMTELEAASWRFHAQPAGNVPTDPHEAAKFRLARALPLARESRPTMIRLATRRNELARAEGYADFFELKVDIHETPMACLDALLASAKAGTETAMRALVSNVEAAEGKPLMGLWQFQGAIQAHFLVPTERLVAVDRASLDRLDKALGLPDWGIPHDLKVAPFASGGMCSPVDPRQDIRIVVSNRLSRSTQHSILLHEYGHALHACGMARMDLPFHLRTLLKGEAGPICEALAILFERLVGDADWLAVSTDGSPAEVAAWATNLQMIFVKGIRTNMFEAAFERALYADPTGDLEAVRCRLAREYFMFDVPRDEAELWACDPLLISFPVYHICYVLAELAAHQLRSALGGTLWDNPEVGPFLMRHFYEPAATIDWREKLQRATGEPLSAEATIEALAGAALLFQRSSART